jgi:predicted GTPase
MEENRHLVQAIAFLRKSIPAPFRNQIAPELKVLEDYIAKSRNPRVALIGRRGAGKSSIVNAIIGDFVAETGAVLAQTPAGTWYAYKSGMGAMEVLDTRGVGEGERPAGATVDDAIQENMKTIHDRCPDVVLYTVKAADVDVWIDNDMDALSILLKAIKRRHGVDIPVIGVLTQVDVLHPSDINEPPFADPEKQANIQIATERLEQTLQTALGQPVPVFATCAYMRRKADTVLDRRWQIDVLVTYLIEQLPHEARWEMVTVAQVKTAKLKLANVLVKAAASVAAAIAATPIPLADIIPITGAQVAMVTGIAYLAGRTLTRNDVLEFLAAVGVNVGVAAGLREFFRSAVKFVPVAGEIASAGIAYWGTYAIGQAAIAYYIERQSLEAAKKVREDAEPGDEAAPAAQVP